VITFRFDEAAIQAESVIVRKRFFVRDFVGNEIVYLETELGRKTQKACAAACGGGHG
jgi:hypothetical protein